MLASLAGEMAAFGAASPHGFSILLDDFHQVERSEETDPIVAALLEATGPGFSLVLTARTDPELPPVKLRGTAVNRLADDDLRFTASETEALFNETYGIALERDVAVDLAARTEGWAALLSLVRTRLEEQSDPDPRALVSQLSAAKGDLYDFLAEEVLVDLPPELHDFLMRVSILTEPTLKSVRLLDQRDQVEVAASLRAAEKLGFLTRSGPNTPYRFNSLVREALAARLVADVGDAEFRRLNQLLALEFEDTDWRASAWHYRAAGEPAAAARVIDGAVPSIIAAGDFETVAPFLDGTAGPAGRAGALILRSRLEFSRGNFHRALELAHDAESRATGSLARTARLNVTALEGVAGVPDDFAAPVEPVEGGLLADAEARVAEATQLVRQAQVDANLAVVADALRDLAGQQDYAGLKRYASISRINLANVLIWLGELDEAVRAAVAAETGFGSDAVFEKVAALTARATALIQLGKYAEADLIFRKATTSTTSLGRTEAQIELAMLEANYGSLTKARIALERVDRSTLPEAYVPFYELAAGTIAVRDGDLVAARSHGSLCAEKRFRDIAGKFRTDILLARASGRSSEDREDIVREASRLAEALASRPARSMAAVLRATTDRGRIASEIASLPTTERHVLSVLAEEISSRLQDLSPDALEVVRQEALLRGPRWSSALRLAILDGGPSTERAAILLSEVGDSGDAEFLRSRARADKVVRDPAAAAIRRLAARGILRDLGVVRLELSSGPLERSARRKALALLCFLATRPRQAATRDEAVEALWPDCTPEMGLNSLHQAIYYVRRIFDPDFKEGVSAGYLTFDGEVVILDRELVTTDSGRCWSLLRSTSTQDLEATDAIVALYHNKFAIDFMYEEWATDYRETLHAAVLGRIEAAVSECLATGRVERAIAYSTAALTVDPSADSIELGLLRAYKSAGRIAAAREQYAHYSTTLRDQLGVEPPAFDTI
ncbi:MAG: BTAD domain-containing putative transcriptional regulator [Chloroflexota bacterium]